jgi:glyoxylase-like metal-dependent hydrolase (beta-lactamase superfamily II)
VPDALAPAVGAPEVEAALVREFAPLADVALPVNALLVDTGERRVLIDCGSGPTLGPTIGRLPPNLAAAGWAAGDIDLNELSHVHGDHAYGVLDAAGGLAFPNARYVVGAEEWRFWMTDPVDSVPRS